MPLFLSHRQPHLFEEMDREYCDPILLKNTYRQFAIINQLLSRWEKIYNQELRPMMEPNKSYSLLDIGFGGGDVPIKLAELALKDGIDLQITAIDTDKRAYTFSQSLKTPKSISFRHCSSSELIKEHQSFDFVISNHLLHHLPQNQLSNFLEEAKCLSTRKIIFNDIERSDIGYALFNTFSRMLFRNSFVTVDGLTSIKRSYTKSELENIIPVDWSVQKILPFRLILKHEK